MQSDNKVLLEISPNLYYERTHLRETPYLTSEYSPYIRKLQKKHFKILNIFKKLPNTYKRNVKQSSAPAIILDFKFLAYENTFFYSK